MFFTHKRKGSSRYEVMRYSLPVFHSGKSNYVDFLAYDPVSGTMRRKKYMLDHIRKVSERKAQAAELMANITRKVLTISTKLISWNMGVYVLGLTFNV